MGKRELKDILKRTSQIEKQLKPMGGSIMPELKTINRSVDFQIWKTELKEELLMLKQDPLIVDILHILDNGFRNGVRDEKDFVDLQGKLSVLSSRLDNYFDIHTEGRPVTEKMKKDTVVKTAFDEYTLVEQVGEGGNGKVFSATNAASDFVAIKFVEKNIPTNKLKRFKNEIYFCEQHKHKNIVEILDRGYVSLNNKDYVFYVMPFYAETLRDKMNARINPEDAVSIFIGLIEGLGFAHKLGTIHRDIKPENIMFKADSLEPIICDFGIAHFAEEELLTIIETKKSDRMANFQYAAPEQRTRGEEASFQTDIYAAALIMNEMFTGEVPQTADYTTIASVTPDYKFMDDVFIQMFKKNASERLYPEEKILTEMKVRAEQYRREQEMHRLQEVVDDVIRPEIFDAAVIKKEFVNGSIVFTLNRELPNDWFEILSSGHLGSYSELADYGPEKLEKDGKSAVSMHIRTSESTDSIKKIIANVMDWIPKANAVYSAHIKSVAQQEQREKEAARKAEIAKLERENEIAAIIASL